MRGAGFVGVCVGGGRGWGWGGGGVGGVWVGGGGGGGGGGRGGVQCGFPRPLPITRAPPQGALPIPPPHHTTTPHHHTHYTRRRRPITPPCSGQQQAAGRARPHAAEVPGPPGSAQSRRSGWCCSDDRWGACSCGTARHSLAGLLAQLLSEILFLCSFVLITRCAQNPAFYMSER